MQWRSGGGGGGGCLGGLSTSLCPEHKAYNNVKALVYYCSPCKDIVCSCNSSSKFDRWGCGQEFEHALSIQVLTIESSDDVQPSSNVDSNIQALSQGI